MTLHTLTLSRLGHAHVITYAVGDEVAVLGAISDMVGAGTIDWGDAAALSYQLGRHLATELKGASPRKAGS